MWDPLSQLPPQGYFHTMAAPAQSNPSLPPVPLPGTPQTPVPPVTGTTTPPPGTTPFPGTAPQTLPGGAFPGMGTGEMGSGLYDTRAARLLARRQRRDGSALAAFQPQGIAVGEPYPAAPETQIAPVPFVAPEYSPQPLASPTRLAGALATYAPRMAW